MRLTPLPIDAKLPELLAALEARRGLVLTAEPGTGKTTRLPPALSEALAGQGQVLVLEPRRLAVRLAAKRVAEERGLRLGEEVGYQVRLERVASPRTRLLYVTEGVLTRRLADERGGLDGVAAVVLDELHERHVDTDLALSLLERLRRTRRPDLRVVAMSATLDAEPVAKFLDAAQVHVEAPHHPVEVEHAPTRDDRPLEDRVRDALDGLLERGLTGHVLVFLPGTAEIGRCERALEGLARRADLRLFPLHGRLEPDATEAALRPGGARKVLLATNVAESSVTIDGVSAVIDSGLARVPGLSAAGLETLELQPISQASAKQRAGRAGRQGPGRCVRLYSKADHDRRPRTATPELLRTDLAPVALSLRGAGVADLSEVRWLDAPPAPALAAADDLLVRLGAASSGPEALTPLGRELLRFPLHPRHARVLVEGARRGVGRAAAAAVALLAEGDPRARAPGPPRQADVEGPSDVLHLLDLLAEADAAGGRAHRVRDLGLHPPGVDAIRRTFKQLLGLLPRTGGGADDEVLAHVKDDEEKLAIALLAGHPDRVARRQGPRTFVLAAGGHVEQAAESVVRDQEWVVVLDATDLKRGGTAPRAHLVSALRPEWLVDLFPEQLREVRGARWNADLERVDASWRLVYGDLAVEESAEAGDAAEVEAVLLKAATQKGLQAFCDAPALDAFLRRLTFARTLDPSIPEAGPAEVEATLAALCAGRRSFKELRAADLLNTLRATLDPRGQLARLAPTHVQLPGGRRCEVNYEMRQPPWIASRLQDFFGLTDGPAVGAGKVKLTLHLLAPNKQAVNITSDLAGFWERHYPAARRELGRRYPRHSWPEDPKTATPPPPKGNRPR